MNVAPKTELPPPKWLLRWEPMETAPKDGTHVLVYIPATKLERYDTVVPALIYVCRYVHDQWQEAGGEQWEIYRPTHWMRLPEPPR